MTLYCLDITLEGGWVRWFFQKMRADQFLRICTFIFYERGNIKFLSFDTFCLKSITRINFALVAIIFLLSLAFERAIKVPEVKLHRKREYNKNSDNVYKLLYLFNTTLRSNERLTSYFNGYINVNSHERSYSPCVLTK